MPLLGREREESRRRRETRSTEHITDSKEAIETWSRKALSCCIWLYAFIERRTAKLIAQHQEHKHALVSFLMRIAPHASPLPPNLNHFVQLRLHRVINKYVNPCMAQWRLCVLHDVREKAKAYNSSRHTNRSIINHQTPTASLARLLPSQSSGRSNMCGLQRRWTWPVRES